MTKDNKCIYCQHQLPKDRQGLLTCKRECSKQYTRISRQIRGRAVSKHITENKNLKKNLKEFQDALEVLPEQEGNK